MQAADETAFQRLGGRKHPTGETPLEGLAYPDDPREEPAGGTVGHDPARRVDEADLGPFGQNPDVHRQGHRRAHTHRGAVDRRDHRLERAEDAQHQLPSRVARDRPVADVDGGTEGLRPPTEIGPGAERPTGPGDHDRTDRVVGVGLVERLEQLAEHGPVEGVQAVRPVEGDRRHPVGDRVGQCLGHGRSGPTINPPSTRGACRSSAPGPARRTGR